MNLGQTMITMGMFVLLVMSVISANRMLVENAEVGLQTEALMESATLAGDLFQEAQSKLFDHLIDPTDTIGTQTQSEFSSPSGGSPSNSEWGPSAAERSLVGSLPDSSYTGQFKSINAYDDVDDYNGYKRITSADTANGIRIGGYVLTVRVSYVDPANLEVAVPYQTFIKRIEIDVEHHPYMDTLPSKKMTYSSLMSY